MLWRNQQIQFSLHKDELGNAVITGLRWPRTVNGDIQRRIRPNDKHSSTLTDGDGVPQINSRRIQVEQRSAAYSNIGCRQSCSFNEILYYFHKFPR